jgi:hypothetical protein
LVSVVFSRFKSNRLLSNTLNKSTQNKFYNNEDACATIMVKYSYG